MGVKVFTVLLSCGCVSLTCKFFFFYLLRLSLSQSLCYRVGFCWDSWSVPMHHSRSLAASALSLGMSEAQRTPTELLTVIPRQCALLKSLKFVLYVMSKAFSCT